MNGDDSFVRREYRNFVPIESLVTAQINRIMEYRSKKQHELFQESVDALIDLLPPKAEETVLQFKKDQGVRYDISPEGKERYVVLFRFIKKHLSDSNIIWKRSRAYEVGHD